MFVAKIQVDGGKSEGGEDRKKERMAERKKETSQYRVTVSFNSGPEFESHINCINCLISEIINF